MSHLDYYHYQSEARGVRSLEDVQRIASEKSYLYDRLVRAWLPTDTTRPIGELACGHGSFLQWLRSRNFTDLAGVDSSEVQVSLARQVGARVDLDDVNHWLARQPNNHFSALMAIDLIEHLSKDEVMALLRNAQATLVPGGSLILRLPNGDSPFVGRNLFNDITHVWTYTPNCLNSLAMMQGYSRTEFKDEASQAIRDHRWIKVPLAQLSVSVIRILVQAATREKIHHLSPHLWACLVK
jgi:SAM-dependent methyltransferase